MEKSIALSVNYIKNFEQYLFYKTLVVSIICGKYGSKLESIFKE